MNRQGIQSSHRDLLKKRHNPLVWRFNTAPGNKGACLDPLSERATEAPLQVLDPAVTKAKNPARELFEECHQALDRGPLEMDYACCVNLDYLSAAEKERLEFELKLSADVQQALLPREVLAVHGLEMAAFSRPATIVGGDYFDFYQFRDGTYGLLIADVAGHGMAASLIMANLQASLRILVPEHDAPNDVMRRLNQLFYHNINMTSFVSMFLAQFDTQTNELSYSNAGHNPPLLYRGQASGQKRFTWLHPTGVAIGLAEAQEFGTKTITVEPGDLLLLYTDGVTESMNPDQEEFGTDRLVEAMLRSPHRSAQDAVQGLRDRMLEFTRGRPLADDTTIVAYRFA